MSSAQVAVIGGSGFYEIEGLSEIEELRVDTPFGPPSDAIVLGTLDGTRVAFLPRHGVGHRLLPGELPARANIWALKELGVERIIAVSAVGSLREEIAPLHVVVPDQLIDRTRGRMSTFFGQGLVAHIAFDEPFCPTLRAVLAGAAGAETAAHSGGAYVVIEGPAFSTKAESFLYRSWDARVIGMTALPEAKLAREAEICYATLALVTDYDTWHDDHDPVSADLIIQNLGRNVETARRVVAQAVRALPAARDCQCASALATALVTAPELVPEETKRRLGPIVSRYMPVGAAR
ncbi:MAG: S-methyl-5'-thioadenosine phosphorylase [Dehalococcoidia bacterium]